MWEIKNLVMSFCLIRCLPSSYSLRGGGRKLQTTISVDVKFYSIQMEIIKFLFPGKPKVLRETVCEVLICLKLYKNDSTSAFVHHLKVLTVTA